MFKFICVNSYSFNFLKSDDIVQLFTWKHSRIDKLCSYLSFFPTKTKRKYLWQCLMLSRKRFLLLFPIYNNDFFSFLMPLVFSRSQWFILSVFIFVSASFYYKEWIYLFDFFFYTREEEWKERVFSMPDLSLI